MLLLVGLKVCKVNATGVDLSELRGHKVEDGLLRADVVFLPQRNPEIFERWEDLQGHLKQKQCYSLFVKHMNSKVFPSDSVDQEHAQSAAKSRPHDGLKIRPFTSIFIVRVVVVCIAAEEDGKRKICRTCEVRRRDITESFIVGLMRCEMDAGPNLRHRQSESPPPAVYKTNGDG